MNVQTRVVMNKVHILVEGYAYSGEDESYFASPTSYLVEAGDKKFLVDPGTNKQALLDALKKLQVATDDLSFIYLTHYHPDHFLNIKLFPDLDVYDGDIKWSNDKEEFHQGTLHIEGVEILKTPGHSPEHTSLLIDTEEGKVCIAQDVFWWEDGKQKSDTEEDLINLEDPFATDMDSLRNSRKLVLEKAKWIIPGHGKKFKNPIWK
jgi:glyoxylase-like metal-dependent hydrolase (beta-lactamase superfamily II)